LGVRAGSQDAPEKVGEPRIDLLDDRRHAAAAERVGHLVKCVVERTAHFVPRVGVGRESGVAEHSP
jgi:hypothetical protein